MSHVQWNSTGLRQVYQLLDRKLGRISKRIAQYASQYTRPAPGLPPREPGLPARGRTGELSASYEAYPLPVPLHWRVATDSKHALWTELGTGVWHTTPAPSDDFELTPDPNPRIRPIHSPWLRVTFWDGTVRFLPSVAGQPPRQTLRAAANKAAKEVQRILSTPEGGAL